VSELELFGADGEVGVLDVLAEAGEVLDAGQLGRDPVAARVEAAGAR